MLPALALPLSWPRLLLNSVLASASISLGGLLDLVNPDGVPAFRDSNPLLAALIAGFTFPAVLFLGFTDMKY